MYETYYHLGVHVFASNVDVIRAARRHLMRRVRYDPRVRAQRKAFYRALIEQHHKARAVYIYAMGGLD